MRTGIDLSHTLTVRGVLVALKMIVSPKIMTSAWFKYPLVGLKPNASCHRECTSAAVYQNHGAHARHCTSSSLRISLLLNIVVFGSYRSNYSATHASFTSATTTSLYRPAKQLAIQIRCLIDRRSL